MYYVYVLKKNNSKLLYFGYTKNLEQRNRSHRHDRRNDYELVYYEAFKNKEDAEQREKDLKNFGSGYGHLKKRIKRSLE
ncbi:MAG: GIY-YIG nuclease family protein [Candidatus Yanofskybacteria bacterium]|nr:GIY-YIG nuclease family protein [Candidatus Yanofskybacteria bacterium]